MQSTIWADPNKYFKSMYEEDYPPKQIDNQGVREEAKRALIQLRSSNILLGNSSPDYQTLHTETYVPLPLAKDDKQLGPGFDLKATNMNFGTDSVNYLSSKQDDFGWKQPSLSDKNQAKDLARDLRAHHYELGNDAPTLKSDYIENYTEKQPPVHSLENFQNPRKNNFSIKHHPFSGDNHYVSEYNDATGIDLRPNNIIPAGVNGSKDGLADFKSNINLGDGNFGPMISEQHEKYIPKDLSSRKQVDNKLLKSNLHFGNVPVDYGTTYNAEHTNKGVIPKDGKSDEIMRDLRSNHYELGYQGVRFYISVLTCKRDIFLLHMVQNLSTEGVSLPN